MQTTPYSKYFDPHYLSKIKSFPLTIKELVEGFISGYHKSNKFGINIEFKDHRAYNAGDEIRHIDWRLYAKTDKFYIKRFDEETNLFVNVLFDISKSMAFKNQGPLSKFEYSQYLAGSLLYLSLLQNDFVGLNLFSHKIVKSYNPGNKLVYVNEILNELEAIPSQGQSEFKKNLIYLSEKINKRSLVIIISDFLSDINEIIDGIKYLKSKKNDIILFVVNDQCEIDFKFKSNTKFIDLEKNDFLIMNANAIREEYIRSFQNHYKALSQFAHKSNLDIDYFNTSQSFDEILYNYLLKRSKYLSK